MTLYVKSSLALRLSPNIILSGLIFAAIAEGMQSMITQNRETDYFDYFCSQYTKTHHEANLSQRPVAGNSKNTPPNF
jgi:hypothetical protein